MSDGSLQIFHVSVRSYYVDQMETKSNEVRWSTLLYAMQRRTYDSKQANLRPAPSTVPRTQDNLQPRPAEAQSDKYSHLRHKSLD